MQLNLSMLRTLISQKHILGAIILTVVLAVFFVWVLLPKNSQLYSVSQDELIALAGNVRNHYKIRPDYWGLNNESAVKNNLIPENMRRGQKAVSSLGREIIIGQDNEGNMVMPGGRNFMLTIANLSKPACLAMLSWRINPEANPGLIRIRLTETEKTTDFEWGGNPALPISADMAKIYCKNRNTISWTFE